MIKLMGILREVTKEPTSLKNALEKLSPEDRKKYEKALEIIKGEEDVLTESALGDKLKKLILPAAVIFALQLTPDIAFAQDAIKQASITTTNTSDINTKVNTSDISTLINKGVKGNELLKKYIPDTLITIEQMVEWNNFVDWMKDKGYSGKDIMDTKKERDKVLKEYLDVFPGFWVKSDEDVKKVQVGIKLYRIWTLIDWMSPNSYTKITYPAGPEGIGYRYNAIGDELRKAIEDEYMKFVPLTKDDGKNGRYTSTFKFPHAFLKVLNSIR